ncbi:MAG: HlyC/CorC family transporter [Lachnospiraceae bacterium]|nr:HlyC/CorC family transporter [Lachnospiraceae bacterium]
MEENRSLLVRLRDLIHKKKSDEDTDEEIISMVNDYKDQGALEEGEAEMITNIMEFSDTQVKDIMTHRSKMDAISKDTSMEKALHHMLHCNYTRYPLYDTTDDNIIGILYLKDVMLAYLEGDRETPLSEIAREPFCVPETLPIDSLFDEMQRKKIHMAVVIDEYGQTSGIVCMEDILEEIVGDIQDEYDKEEVVAKKKGDALFVKGSMPLEELSEKLPSLEIAPNDMDNFETLNGLLISLLDHIPADGEKAVIPYGGYVFDILSCRHKMVYQVKITPLKKETKNE